MRAGGKQTRSQGCPPRSIGGGSAAANRVPKASRPLPPGGPTRPPGRGTPSAAPAAPAGTRCSSAGRAQRGAGRRQGEGQRQGGKHARGRLAPTPKLARNRRGGRRPACTAAHRVGGGGGVQRRVHALVGHLEQRGACGRGGASGWHTEAWWRRVRVCPGGSAAAGAPPLPARCSMRVSPRQPQAGCSGLGGRWHARGPLPTTRVPGSFPGADGRGDRRVTARRRSQNGVCGPLRPRGRTSVGGLVHVGRGALHGALQGRLDGRGGALQRHLHRLLAQRARLGCRLGCRLQAPQLGVAVLRLHGLSGGGHSGCLHGL